MRVFISWTMFFYTMKNSLHFKLIRRAVFAILLSEKQIQSKGEYYGQQVYFK